MNTLQDEVRALPAKVNGTWDFKGVAAELASLGQKVQTDGTLLDLEKKRLSAGILAASRVLAERRKSPQHLLAALSSVAGSVGEMSEEQASHLASWFFGVAYSGTPVTPELEQSARPILAKSQGNPGSNKVKLSGDLERYRRLANWGTDLVLSENNLRGFLVALRVLALPTGYAEEARVKCEEALAALEARKGLSPGRLVTDSLRKCQDLVGANWVVFSRGEERYLEQHDTFVLNICLSSLLTKIGETEELADSAQELTEAVNTLRSKFQRIRYPSSTTLLARLKQDIQALEQRLANSIEFGELKEEVKKLQVRLREAKHGRKGVNWMYEAHVDEGLAAAAELWDKIVEKEHSASEFNLVMRVLEDEISATETQTAGLSAGHLKRLMARVRNDSPLVRWIPTCFREQSDRREAFKRVDAVREKLGRLWKRMEDQQEERLAEFRQMCTGMHRELASSVDLRQTLREIQELGRCIEDYPRSSQQEMRGLMDGLYAAFAKRAADLQALTQMLKGIHDDIDRAHRRIYARIDFEALDRRAGNGKGWVTLREFPHSERDRMLIEVKRCFGEIRKLRFRQDKMLAERQARSNELTAELEGEITETVMEASKNPGNPEMWNALVDLDRRLRESWHTLTEEQGRSLRKKMDEGFQGIRAARAAFAAEAARVFAEYNELLSDILFGLEEAASRDGALEAIDRIKPVRASLRAETKLLGGQRRELNGLLSAISCSINEIFEKASAQAAEEFNRLKADIEDMEGKIRNALDWRTASNLIDTHKSLSAEIREADLSIAARKECRTEMDRLWEELSERLRALRFTRTQTADLDATLSHLERQGYLLFVSDVPNVV